MKIYAAKQTRSELIRKLAGKGVWVRSRIDFQYGDRWLNIIEFTDTSHQNPLFWKVRARYFPVSSLDAGYTEKMPISRIAPLCSLWVMDIYIPQPIEALTEEELLEALYKRGQ